MTAYYNEFDPFAAEWLRELIKEGHVAPGVVDTRSVEDVSPADLAGFTQCHFFAGIGVWSYALRQAGWPDDRPVWTGSCPCQPFSAAGKGNGFADERHLWPAFFHLISQCRPVVVFGEQVASKDGLAWIDLVHADLEGEGYAVGAVDSCAAGLGAPHIRQRMYWVADAECGQRRQGRVQGHGSTGTQVCAGSAEELARVSMPCGLADATSPRREREVGRPEGEARDEAWLRVPGEEFNACGLADSELLRRDTRGTGNAGTAKGPGSACRDEHAGRGCFGGTSPTDGQWRDADWLLCRDGKWRPVEPGSQPLAHGAANRVGRLRGYGNAIVAPQAQAFVEAYLETRKTQAG